MSLRPPNYTAGDSELAGADAVGEGKEPPQVVIDSHVVESILDVANGEGNTAGGGVAVSDDLSPAEPFGRKKRESQRRCKPPVRLPGVENGADVLLALLVYNKYSTNSSGSKHTTARPILSNRLMKPT